MSILTLTAQGQVTLREDILQHLGIEPGGRLLVEKLPDGGVSFRATKLTGTIEDVLSRRQDGQGRNAGGDQGRDRSRLGR